MDRGSWWSTVYGVTEDSDMTQQLNNKNQLQEENKKKNTNMWKIKNILVRNQLVNKEIKEEI